jgi:hypothetical protein
MRFTFQGTHLMQMRHGVPPASRPSSTHSQHRPTPARYRASCMVMPVYLGTPWSVIGFPISPTGIHEDPYTCVVFSSHQQMLLVVVNQTRTGTISPHLSKIVAHKLNHKTCSTLTSWAITAWSMIPLRHKGNVIILSVTMPELLRVSRPKSRPPHQHPCVLTSFFGVHIPNHTLYQR